MGQIRIPVGISDFEKIRTNQYYYVDKSGLIAELLKEESAEVHLITRPRRFGKTMAMSMLASFFDIRKSSKKVFEGLEIMEQPELCAAWMNQWPTVFFSLKDIDGLTFESAMGQLRLQMADLYKQYVFLLDSERIDPDDKALFLKIKAAEADDTELSRSLLLLMRMLQNCYQKPVILLLDEYDVPAAKASSHGYYDRMMEVIKIMLQVV